MAGWLLLNGVAAGSAFVIFQQSLSVAAWGAANTGFACIAIIFRWRVLAPLRRMAQMLRHASALMEQERSDVGGTALTIRSMAGEVARFAQHAQLAYARYQDVSRELDVSRQLLAQVTTQQQTILASTNREIVAQYRAVLSYAHYLDEHIQQKTASDQLRYDFDDVCESSFNLKLIAQSLELLRKPMEQPRDPVVLARLLQQTLIALAPALERRSMKLSTGGVDLETVAHADPATIAHVLWMMLLGTIRYAAAESSLRMRCTRSRDGSQAILSLIISELEPGKLSATERQAHLARQLQHLTPHMFAETIRLHGNIQLAELLLARMDARISVVPLTSHACEICLILPTGPVSV